MGPGSAGLGAALTAAVADLVPALLALASWLCYVLAALAFGAGCLRLLKAAEDRFRAPSAVGTALTFTLAPVLASFPTVLGAAGATLFGDAAGRTTAALGYAGAAGADYDAMLRAALAVVQVIGLGAFVRGWFVLRNAADARQGATTGRAFAHLIGGVGAWHVAALIEAVQTTLGLRILNVS